MNIKEKMSLNLLEIYNYEVAHQNFMIRIEEGNRKKCPIAFVFENPLRFHLTNKLPDKVQYLEFLHPNLPSEAGYLCLDTNQQLVGPPLPKVERIPKVLSRNLIDIYNYEISHGNSVKSIDEPGGSKCPLAINFVKALTYKIDDAELSNKGVECFRVTDSHYPRESGYKCIATGQIITGPL